MKEFADIFTTAPLRLASRASQLALRQADIVKDAIAPVAAEILPITTMGDKVLDRSLADAGGKGLFIKELEKSILAGTCDAAVHSMKDMETSFADGTEIAAVLPREDRRDALLGGYESLAALPRGAGGMKALPPCPVGRLSERRLCGGVHWCCITAPI